MSGDCRSAKLWKASLPSPSPSTSPHGLAVGRLGDVAVDRDRGGVIAVGQRLGEFQPRVKLAEVDGDVAGAEGRVGALRNAGEHDELARRHAAHARHVGALARDDQPASRLEPVEDFVEIDGVAGDIGIERLLGEIERLGLGVNDRVAEDRRRLDNVPYAARTSDVGEPLGLQRQKRHLGGESRAGVHAGHANILDPMIGDDPRCFRPHVGIDFRPIDDYPATGLDRDRRSRRGRRHSAVCAFLRRPAISMCC